MSVKADHRILGLYPLLTTEGALVRYIIDK